MSEWYEYTRDEEKEKEMINSLLIIFEVKIFVITEKLFEVKFLKY